MNDAMLGYLRYVLTAPMTITGAELWHRPRGMVGSETIVWFPKVLLVVRGELEYDIDGRQLVIPAGHLLYRPAWTRAHWRSAAAPLDLAFCEFDLPTAGSTWQHPFVQPAGDPQRESAVLQRITTLYHAASDAAILEAAGELKALLARLFTAAAAQADDAPARPAAAGAIDAALEHAGRHFAQRDVLGDLQQRSGLGINRFRVAFKQRVGITPQQYILTLRMRAARYYLCDARMQLKQVALAVGYDDPLYFSRVYRQFWGHPPSADRHRPTSGAQPPMPPMADTFKR